MKKYGNEVKVGIFIVASLVLLLYLTFSTGKVRIKEEGYSIYVSFNDVSGIQKNSPVMLNGLEVGRVVGLSISSQADKTKILLKLLINNGVKISSDPTVSIKTLGLMGEKYVHIKAMGAKGFVEPNARLRGKEPTDIDTILNETEVLSKDVTVLVSKVKTLTENLNQTVQENRESIFNMMNNFESTSENFEEFSQDLKRHPWKLLYRSNSKSEKE